MPIPDLSPKPEIDFAFLADRAEAIGNRLYCMGGCWDRLIVPPHPHPQPLALAISVLVPWSMANTEIPVKIRLEKQSGEMISPEAVGVIAAAPAPDAVAGKPLRIILTGGHLWTLPGPGHYRVVINVGEAAPKAVTFQAVAPPAQYQA